LIPDATHRECFNALLSGARSVIDIGGVRSGSGMISTRPVYACPHTARLQRRRAATSIKWAWINQPPGLTTRTTYRSQP